MEDQITDYLGKESEVANEDLSRNQKLSLYYKDMAQSENSSKSNHV